MDHNDRKAGGSAEQGSYASTEGMAWAADETLDDKVLDAVRRWLDRMEEAADRTASASRSQAPGHDASKVQNPSRFAMMHRRILSRA
jgi:hypothetical protein